MTHTNGLSEAAGVAMPKESTLKRMVQSVRNRHQNLPVQPMNLIELAIPAEFQTHNEERFLLDDFGEGNDRILIFGSEQNLLHLQEAQEFYSDGTFDACPPLFAQLMTVHVKRHDFVRPLVYALLPNKTQATYRNFYQRLAAMAPHLHPQRWMCDFERANMNAVREVFNIEPSGCFFHLAQCVYRKAVAEGLKQQLEQDDSDLSLWLRCLPALAFVPVDSVEATFDSLILLDGFPENLAVVANYFEDQWIGRRLPNGNRRAPRFSINTWNVRARTLAGLHRTNNSVEGWHRRLQSVLGCRSPQIFKLLNSLKSELDHQNWLIQRANAGEAPDWKRSYARSNEMILRITERWNEAEGLPEDFSIQQFLRGLAHHLKN